MRLLLKRGLCALLCAALVFQSAPIQARADVQDTLYNGAEENERLLEELKDIAGDSATAREVLADLQNMGLLDEEGKIVTSQSIMVDGTPMTLGEVKRLIADPDVDPGKTVTVEGQTLTLRSIQTMLEIEEELSRIEKEYFSGSSVEITPQHQEAYADLVNYVQENGLQLELPETAAVVSVNHNGRVRVTRNPQVQEDGSGKVSFVFQLVDKDTGNALLPAGYEVTADYETRDGSAMAGRHYKAAKGTVTLNEGNGFTQTVEVETYRHDTASLGEGSSYMRWNGTQSFYLYVSSPVNALLEGELRAQLLETKLSNQYSWMKLSGSQIGLGTLECNPPFTPDKRSKYTVEKTHGGLTDEQKQAAIDGILYQIQVRYAADRENINELRGEERVPGSPGAFYVDTQKAANYCEVIGTDILTGIGTESYYYIDIDSKVISASQLGKISVTAWGDTPATPKYTQRLTDQYLNRNFVSVDLLAKSGIEVVGCTAPAGEYMSGTMVPVTVEFTVPVQADNVRLGIVGVDGTVVLIPADTGMSRRVTFLYEVPADPGSELVIENVTGGRSYYSSYQYRYEEVKLKLEGVSMVRDDLRAFSGIAADKQEAYGPDDTVTLALNIDKKYSRWLESADQTMELDGNIYLGKTYLQVDGDTYPLMMDPSTTGEAEGSRYLAQIPAREYAALTEQTKTAELYYDGQYIPASTEGTSYVPAHFEGGSLVVGVAGSFRLSPVVLIESMELDETSYPDNNQLYKMSQTAVRLKIKSITLSNGFSGSPEEALSQATYPQIRWISGNTDVAVVNADNGSITVKGEGETAFRAAAGNGGFSGAVTAETPVFRASVGGPPNVLFQEGSDIFVADRGGAVTVMWVESVTDVKPDAVFRLELYEGNLSTGELEGKTPLLTQDITGASEYTIGENVLNIVSENSVPSYTVCVSTPDPDLETRILRAAGHIVVLPRPAGVRFDKLESYYILDSAGSVGIRWRLSEYSGGDFSFEVSKNGVPYDTEQTAAIKAVPDSQEPGQYELMLDPVPEGTLKDVYTVNVKAKNTAESNYSEDSFLLHVYDEDAMKILIDGEAPVLNEENRLVMDNNETIRNLYEQEGSEGILALQRNIRITRMLSINYNDYPWGSVTDQIQWDDGSSDASREGRKKVASINYPASIYSDISDMDYSSYRPSQEFLLAGLWDGETTITATHARTGQSKKLDVSVSTLKDKLYLFQFYPGGVTQVTYVNGDGETISLASNNRGELAVYDEAGIASDVSLSGGTASDRYLGTIYEKDLLSMEGNPAHNELYPVNHFKLRRVAYLELYLKDAEGNPYTGEITYRGAVYKNGQLCPDTMNGAVMELDGTVYGDEEAKTIQIGGDGRFELSFDATQFWCQDHGETLEVTDEIQFIYEVKFPEDDWYPQLITVDGSLNETDWVDFGENIVTVRACEDANKETPFLSAFFVDYGLNSGRELEVTYHTGSIGASNSFPDPKLRTLALLWGCSPDGDGWEDYEMELSRTIDGQKMASQSQKNFVYPFSTIPYVENYSSLSSESTGMGKGYHTRASVTLKNSSGYSLIENAPFKLVNMVGVTEVHTSYTVEEKLKALQDSGKNDLDLLDLFTGESFMNVGMSMISQNGGASLMDNKVCQLKLVGTEDPTVFKGIILLNADFIGEIGRPMIDYPQEPDQRLNYTPAILDVISLISNPRKWTETQNSNMAAAKNGTKGLKDVGGQAAGYFECEVRYDVDSDSWICVTTGGGFTVAANIDYAWYANFLVGVIVPVTLEVAAGGIIMLDFKSTLPVEEEVIPYELSRDDLNDYLTTLRLWFYARAFAGLGFDYSVIALKVGIFGQVDVDNYNYFLTRTYASGKDLRAQRTTLHPELGIKFLFKLLFLSYEHVFATTDDIQAGDAVLGDGYTWKTGDTDAMENWMKKTDFPMAIPGYNSTQGGGNTPLPTANVLAANAGLTQVYSGFHMEDRSYLERYPRYWGDSGAATMALDEVSRLSNLEFNTYPYANPVVTGDGRLVAYLSDSGSSDLNDTKASYARMGADGNYENPQAFPDVAVVPGPEICDYCGLERTEGGCVCQCPVCGLHPDDCTCEHPYCGYCGLRRYTQAQLDELSEEEKAQSCQCRCEECGQLYLDCTCVEEEIPKARADSSLDLDGSGEFAAAVWERQSYLLPENGSTPSSQELDAMINGTEIYASVLADGSWVTARLTENATADLSPVTAARNGRAVAVWRATAGSSSAIGSDGMPQINYDDRYDSIRYRIYENGAWGETGTLYSGNLGNVKSLDAAMMADGTAAVAYTVDTDKDGVMENGEGYETALSILSPQGQAYHMMRLSTNDSIDQNARVAAVTFPDGKERFVTAWYSGVSDEEGLSASDIRFAAWNSDASPETAFVDALSDISATTGANVTDDFQFAKGENLSLEDLTLLWSEPVLAYDESDQTEAQADALKAVKFCLDEENGRIYLTPALEVAGMVRSTVIDHFDACVKGDNGVSAVLLTSSYTGEPQHVSGDVYVVDPVSSMQTATETFRNAIQVEGITMDQEALRSGGRMGVSFTVANIGLNPITGLEIRIGDNEVQSFETERLLPNSKISQNCIYQVPEVIADAEYTVTAYFADGSTAAAQGSLNLDIPDLETATLQMGEWGEGIREFTALLRNRSDVSLYGSENRNVYLGVYKDSNCEKEALVPFRVGNLSVEKGSVYEITKDKGEDGVSQLEMLDAGSLVLNLGYDIRENLVDGLFPEDGITLYVRVWAEETDQEETYELGEFDSYNNSKSIRFTDPVKDNNGTVHDVQVEQTTSEGITTALVTVKNLSMKPSENGNLAATLLDERGQVLETKLYATDASGLIGLGGEESMTFPVVFEQEGNRVEARYFTAQPDEWQNKLALLHLTDVLLEEEFDPGLTSYTGSGVNLGSTVIQAGAQSMDARVEIQAAMEDGSGEKIWYTLGSGTGAASGQLKLETGEDGETLYNEARVTVTPVNEDAQALVYNLNIAGGRTMEGRIALKVEQPLRSGWTNSSSVTVSAGMEGVAGFEPVSADWRINAGTWNRWESPGLEPQDVTFEEDGKYRIEARMTDGEGFRRNAAAAEVWVDCTPPVIDSGSMVLTETSLPLEQEGASGAMAAVAGFFRGLFGLKDDGNTKYQLQVEVPACDHEEDWDSSPVIPTDRASGIASMTIEAGGRTYPMELLTNAEGRFVWKGTVTHEHRGALALKAVDVAGNEAVYETQELIISDSIGTKLDMQHTTEADSILVTGSFHMEEPLSDMEEFAVQYRKAGAEEWLEMTADGKNTPNRFSYQAEGLLPGQKYEYRISYRLVTESEVSYGAVQSCRTWTPVQLTVDGCADCTITADKERAMPGETILFTADSCSEHTPFVLKFNGLELALEGEGDVRTASYTVEDTDRRLDVTAYFRDKVLTGPYVFPGIALKESDSQASDEESLLAYLKGLSFDVHYDNWDREAMNFPWELYSTSESASGTLRAYRAETMARTYYISITVEKEEQTRYWERLVKAVQEAQPGQRVRSDVGESSYIPAYVLQALGEREGVTLVLTRHSQTVAMSSAFAAGLAEGMDYTWEELVSLTARIQSDADKTSAGQSGSGQDGAAQKDSAQNGGKQENGSLEGGEETQEGQDNPKNEGQISGETDENQQTQETEGQDESGQTQASQEDVVVPAPGQEEAGPGWIPFVAAAVVLAAVVVLGVVIVTRRKKQDDEKTEE